MLLRDAVKIIVIESGSAFAVGGPLFGGRGLCLAMAPDCHILSVEVIWKGGPACTSLTSGRLPNNLSLSDPSAPKQDLLEGIAAKTGIALGPWEPELWGQMPWGHHLSHRATDLCLMLSAHSTHLAGATSHQRDTKELLSPRFSF